MVLFSARITGHIFGEERGYDEKKKEGRERETAALELGPFLLHFYESR